MVMAKIDDCHDRTSSIRRLSNVYLRLGQAKGSLLIAPVTNPDGAGSSPGYHNFDVFRPLKCGHPMARKRPSEPLRTVFCLIARSFTVQLPTHHWRRPILVMEQLYQCIIMYIRSIISFSKSQCNIVAMKNLLTPTIAAVVISTAISAGFVPGHGTSGSFASDRTRHMDKTSGHGSKYYRSDTRKVFPEWENNIWEDQVWNGLG